MEKDFRVISVQSEMIRVSKKLEIKGHSIAEVYNTRGYLHMYVDGEHMKLRELRELWRGYKLH